LEIGATLKAGHQCCNLFISRQHDAIVTQKLLNSKLHQGVIRLL
jgi:hypothetical protein